MNERLDGEGSFKGDVGDVAEGMEEEEDEGLALKNVEMER